MGQGSLSKFIVCAGDNQWARTSREKNARSFELCYASGLWGESMRLSSVDLFIIFVYFITVILVGLYILFVYGLKSVWLPFLWLVFNQIFLMMFLSGWLRRSNVLTGAEWIQTRFGRGTGLAWRT